MKLKKLRVYGAMAAIGFGLLTGPKMDNVYAEETLYVEEGDDYEQEDIGTIVVPTPTPEPTPIPDDDKSKENEDHSGCLDKDSGEIIEEGEDYEIPDYVKTERERKGIDEKTPVPVPKTGDGSINLAQILAILANIGISYAGCEIGFKVYDSYKSRKRK